MAEGVWELKGVKRDVRCVMNVLWVADLDESLVNPQRMTIKQVSSDGRHLRHGRSGACCTTSPSSLILNTTMHR